MINTGMDKKLFDEIHQSSTAIIALSIAQTSLLFCIFLYFVSGAC